MRCLVAVSTTLIPAVCTLAISAYCTIHINSSLASRFCFHYTTFDVLNLSFEMTVPWRYKLERSSCNSLELWSSRFVRIPSEDFRLEMNEQNNTHYSLPCLSCSASCLLVAFACFLCSGFNSANWET